MLADHIQNILCYLSTPEVARLYVLNKTFLKTLKDLKAIKKSLWRGDMPESNRARFWIYQCPLYKAQEEVKKLLAASNTTNLYKLISDKIIAEQIPENDKTSTHLTKSDILKDIPRTYLVAGNSKEEQMLLNVLLSLAYIKPSIGYCQGMNFLGAVMLKACKNEEIAFWLLFGMIKKWDMENMYVPGVPDLALREFQMNHYVNTLMPDLYAHFRKVGVTNGFFISRWFMTLFSTFLPLDAIVRVWDCFLLEGWKVIIKVGIALLKELKPVIINYDLEEVSKYIRSNLHEFLYKDILFQCNSIRITKNELRRIEEQFYMEQVNFKLLAVEISHANSEDDLSAIRWAKDRIDDFDETTKNDIEEFQRKISKLDHELDSFAKHYLVVTMDFLRVHNELETLTEKQNLYNGMLESLQKKFKKSKLTRFFQKIIKNKKSSKKENSSKMISQEDLDTFTSKLKSIEKELEDLNLQYSEKAQIYKEAFAKGQELNDRKKKYSAQLCEFLKVIK